MRMVQRSQTAMERRTMLVGDCMPGLLRIMMMMVLETSVMTASIGMMTPSRGKTNSIGPREREVSIVLQVPSLTHLKYSLIKASSGEGIFWISPFNFRQVKIC